MKNLYEPNTFLSLIQLCDYFGLQLLTTASLLSLSLSLSLALFLSHDDDSVSILGHSCLQLREIVLVALTPSQESASLWQKIRNTQINDFLII